MGVRLCGIGAGSARARPRLALAAGMGFQARLGSVLLRQLEDLSGLWEKVANARVRSGSWVWGQKDTEALAKVIGRVRVCKAAWTEFRSVLDRSGGAPLTLEMASGVAIAAFGEAKWVAKEIEFKQQAASSSKGPGATAAAGSGPSSEGDGASSFTDDSRSGSQAAAV